MSVQNLIKPMELEAYNNFVEDFNKLASYSRKSENELKNKYKQYVSSIKLFKLSQLRKPSQLGQVNNLVPNLPACTFGSLFSLLVQRVMKQKYRKSPSISNKYYDLYQSLTKEHSGNKITFLADSQGISPALFARSLLQHVYGDSTMAKRCMKDTNLIDDPELAYEVFLGVMNDNQYGPYSDVIKQCIGQEYEAKLQHDLQVLNITFSDENELRLKGYDKTPDLKLDVPIAVGDFIVHWIESKALFGDVENHSTYLTEQFTSYYNRFGTGMVIYWFGYLETLERTSEVNNMFIINTSLPPKEEITMFDFNAIYPYSQYIKQSSSAYGVFENT